MKVVLIGPAHPYRGGIADFNEALAIAMKNKGWEVEIISFTLQYPSFLFPGKSQKDSTGTGPEGVSIEEMISSVNPTTWFRTAKYIRAKNPDLVIMRYWIPFMGPALGTIASRLGKIPVIAITDNVIPHEKRAGDKLFTSYFVKRVDGFLTMSKAVSKDLRTFTEKKPVVFRPHPIYSIFGDATAREEAARQLGKDPTRQYILFFGLVRKYKGLDLLLEAFGRVKDQLPQVDLLVAGEFYEDPAPYLEIIQNYEMGSRVAISDGFIPSDQVRYYFSLADLVAQTYRTATQSGVTQVAYHYEVPMLVTDAGGLSEIVSNGVNGYVTPLDPDVIGEKLLDYFSQNRQASFEQGVRKEKKRFEWDYFLEGIQEVYASVKDGK